MTGRQDSSAGFTLVEMIAVLAILGVLAVLVYPNLVRFKDQQLTRSGATQVGGVLDDARARASTEAVPYLVFFNDRNAGGNGCGSAATVVRDADRSYSITAGDDVRDVEFEYSVCRVARPFGDPTTVVDSSIPLPTQDLAVRAIGGVGGIVGGLVGGLGGIVGGLVGGGGGGGGGAAPAMLADTVVYGSTFPIDPASGRPVVAFSERGIPVDPQTPTQWGSGAGAMYVTDGRETVYAALVQPLGDVQLRVYDRVAGDWR